MERIILYLGMHYYDGVVFYTEMDITDFQHLKILISKITLWVGLVLSIGNENWITVGKKRKGFPERK